MWSPICYYWDIEFCETQEDIDELNERYNSYNVKDDCNYITCDYLGGLL